MHSSDQTIHRSATFEYTDLAPGDVDDFLERIRQLGEAATVPRLVLDNERRLGNQVAMRRKHLGVWWPITWDEVGEKVRQIAACLLADNSMSYQDRVVIIGDNEPELFWSEWAILAAGLVPVCLYSDATASELEGIITHSRARAVFAEDQEQCDKLLELSRDLVPQIIYWDDRGMHNYTDPRLTPLESLYARGRELLAADPTAVENSVERLGIDDFAVLIYTSGTSGVPKGVSGSHRYLLDGALRWAGVLGVFQFANYVSYISPAWATEQYLGLTLGPLAPLITNFAEEPDTVNADLREIGADFLFFSPRQWEMIVSHTDVRMADAHPLVQRLFHHGIGVLERARQPGNRWARLLRPLAEVMISRPLKDRLGFPRLRAAVSGGTALSPEIFERFAALGIGIRNVYGFTEVGTISSTMPGDVRYESVGRVIPSPLADHPLEVRVQDDEIQVRGGVNYMGYFQAPDLTAGRLTDDGWIRSGDAGYFDGDYLIFLDRVDNMRRLAGGATFAPQFIETRLRLSPFIREVLAVGDESCPYVSVLIDVDFETTSQWAEQHGLEFNTHRELSQHPQVLQVIAREIERVNATLPPVSQVRAFANLFKPLDPDEGEVTRTRKVRRSFVEERYRVLIEALYADATEVDVQVAMQLQDGRERVLRSTVVCNRLDDEPARRAGSSAEVA